MKLPASISQVLVLWECATMPFSLSIRDKKMEWTTSLVHSTLLENLESCSLHYRESLNTTCVVYVHKISLSLLFCDKFWRTDSISTQQLPISRFNGSHTYDVYGRVACHIVRRWLNSYSHFWDTDSGTFCRGENDILPLFTPMLALVALLIFAILTEIGWKFFSEELPNS